ncbi:hypothetical protein D9C73_001770 [Collichthys lucidus]|uniref:Uncharacterized protein n=1 Tax=Collichthys lucidus TaxID=240159 RepID=A0A4U5TYW5_COLLU|nr:hypothetical protein D9C73_001770 [Collichthys lucidus]
MCSAVAYRVEKDFIVLRLVRRCTPHALLLLYRRILDDIQPAACYGNAVYCTITGMHSAQSAQRESDTDVGAVGRMQRLMNGLNCYFVSLDYTVLLGKYSKIFARVKVHKLNYRQYGGDVVIYVQRPKFNLDCVAFLAVQHMLQALASPIAFQVIGQAQREVGFQPHDTSLIHSWIRNKLQPITALGFYERQPITAHLFFFEFIIYFQRVIEGNMAAHMSGALTRLCPHVSPCIRSPLLCSLLRECDGDKTLLKSSFTTRPLQSDKASGQLLKPGDKS